MFESEVRSYNLALEHPITRTVFGALSLMGGVFSGHHVIISLASALSFPNISAVDLVSALRCGGIFARLVDLPIEEAASLPKASVLFLRDAPLGEGAIARVLLSVTARGFRLVDETGRIFHVAKEDMASIWTRRALIVDRVESGRAADDPILAMMAKEIVLAPDFLSPDHCKDLIALCESGSFRRSRVGRSGDGGIVMRKVRSSSSITLYDRGHPILAAIYSACARIEECREEDIESVQCVRYKAGQRFRAHFDASSGIPRRTTFLLYLNDDFDGGETLFPVVRRSFNPVAGACLRFPNALADGRNCWASWHGGMPVRRGTKYALNVWTRFPAT